MSGLVDTCSCGAPLSMLADDHVCVEYTPPTAQQREIDRMQNAIRDAREKRVMNEPSLTPASSIRSPKMADEQPLPFKLEGDSVLVLIESMGWVRIGPADDVMEAMAQLLAEHDYGEGQ